MKSLDPGHLYKLDTLDGEAEVLLRFVKREGSGYPGNKGHYPGTTIQEVCRTLIDRLDYVNTQIPCAENLVARRNLENVIWFLEKRAAKRHGRKFTIPSDAIHLRKVCSGCGHVGCRGCKRRTLN